MKYKFKERESQFTGFMEFDGDAPFTPTKDTYTADYRFLNDDNGCSITIWISHPLMARETIASMSPFNFDNQDDVEKRVLGEVEKWLESEV